MKNRERLAELLGERLRNEARENVDRAAGWKADHEAHRAIRVSLRRRTVREQRSAR